MKLQIYLCLTLGLAVSGCGWLIGIGDRSVGDAGRDGVTHADANGDDHASDVAIDTPLPMDTRSDDGDTGVANAPGTDGAAGAGGAGGIVGTDGGTAGTKAMPADGGPSDAPIEAPPVIIVGPTPGIASFTHIAAASNHSCAITNDNKRVIQCWGAAVGTPPAGQYDALAAGRDFTCGLTDNTGGTVRCGGLSDALGQLNAPTGTFVQIAAGYAHACARQLDGTTVCWGDNTFGQRAPLSDFYADVGAGGNRRCVVNFSGQVQCAGEKITGVYTRPFRTYAHVSAGPTWSCGILASKAIECWDGMGHEFGPVGDSLDHIAVGGDQVCGITAWNDLRCWDLNGSPRPDTPAGSFWEVAVGASHACALLTKNVVLCWGNNTNGQSTPP